ncbi:MAG: AAA family ATPase [Planctomycetaceae bacterium]|nr:AAA family ATPase [Planctomycetaceae bacterium]
MRVVSIVNQKGGCGKTTTAINLAAVLSRGGARTLLVDMDPQSHCAAGLGVPDAGIERTIGDAMLADGAETPRTEEHLWEVGANLRLAPSSVALAGLEAPNGPLAQRHDRDRRLARVLAAWRDEFDWCVVDCPPTIGLLTFNALRASDFVLVPVETGFFSLKGAERQIETIRAVVSRFGRDIPFRLLPTLVSESRALSRDVVGALTKRFPDAMLPLAIGEHEELREAASYGQAITEFAAASAAAADFEALAAWIAANAPHASVLADYDLAAAPIVETASDLDAPTEPAAPAAARAADLAGRLRAIADRSRGGSVGGGFGVRADRDGTVVFTQPLSARTVSVVGDFNGWDTAATPLEPSSDGTRLEAVVTLPPGRHAYCIVVDGETTLDEFNMHRLDGGETGAANLVEVPETAAHARRASDAR